MVYLIYRDGVTINTIVAADESFVANYCASNGYTYALDSREYPTAPDPEPDEPDESLTVWDELDEAYRKGVNSI